MVFRVPFGKQRCTKMTSNRIEYLCVRGHVPQQKNIHLLCLAQFLIAGPRSAVGSASDSLARGTGFDTRSGHILSFLLPLIQEGQLSDTGESMCTKY